MNEFGIAVAMLLVGAVAGAAAVIAARRRPQGAAPPFATVEARLEAQAAEIRRLGDAARSRDGAEDRLRVEVQAAREAVEALRIRDEERRERELAHTEVIRRLSGVLAGGASKGRAGENLLREHLADLPPTMLVTNFRVNGKVVEYGLLLPDGRRLPIDSKWPALRELEALEAATDPAEREAMARELERVVTSRAKEVAGYLDPAVTAPVAVAAVPDAVYAVLRRAHADAFGRGVVIVPYSSALPVVLFLYSLVARFGSAADVQACLAELLGVLDSVELVVENKLSKAAAMLANGTDELRSSVGRARGSIARARAGEAPIDPATPPADPTPEGGDPREVLYVVE